MVPHVGSWPTPDLVRAFRDRRDRLKGYLEKLDRSGDDQLSLSDPDSRAMAPGTKVGVGYNAQIPVDIKHKLITEQEIHSKVADMGLLAQTAKLSLSFLSR